MTVSLSLSQGSIFTSHLLGMDDEGQGWIVENANQYGVCTVTIKDFFYTFKGTVETREFVGTEDERHQAIERVKHIFGSPYNLTNWNCEKFANFVQFNRVESMQVRNTVFAAIGTALWLGWRQ